MRSRTVSRFAVLALLVMLILGVSPGVLAQEELTGEIDVYYQQYYSPDAYPEVAAIVEGIAAAYEEMHPGVTINLVPDVGPGVDYETWLAARMAAGETPDIAWQQFYSRNTRADDWWVPLNEYFEMPNPYIEEGVPGHESWMDSFPGFVMGQTRAPDGNWYQVSIDWVETALFYNIAMFEEAGVEPEWES